MSIDTVIEVKNVFKTFNINYNEKTTVFETLASVKKKVPLAKFNALTNVSFAVKKGEMIGIIGHNGSGKSTLLKVMSGIMKPTSGSVTTKGKLVPFLQLGSGFHPDLNAIENIKMYGMILGINKKEIEKRIPIILKYAGLEQFKDVKAKNFSAGMFARLAFATAIQSDPDILVIDEVLAVGDLEFHQKSYETFLNIKKEGKTIIYVTHNLDEVIKLCDRVILMYKGRVGDIGEPHTIVDKYRTVVEKSPEYMQEDLAQKIAKKYVEILERPADVIGVLEYVYKIKKGIMKLEDIPEIFKSSKEYLDKKNKI